MGSAKSFLDLIVWQKAHKLVLSIYNITNQFPKHEIFGLTSQIRRAAVSVPANIAEGFKRKSKKEKLRFYNISQASLQEVKYFLILSNDLKYSENNELLSDTDEVAKLLESYSKKILASSNS